MTWNPRYDATANAPVQSGPSMRTRRNSGIAAVLLLPALVAAKVAVLMTETGGRCLMYGGCRPFPFVFFAVVCGGVVAAAVVTMAAPRRYQGGALAVQLEAVAVAMVFAYP